MNLDHIPIIAVSYNSPDLIEILLRSIRQFHSNKVYIIDGSADDLVDEIRDVTRHFDNVEFIPFGYNIHHGPGMAWAIQNLGMTGPVLFLDSDVELLHPGAIASLLSHLAPDMYGVGWLTYPQLVDAGAASGTFAYLSPLCMLCNIDVMRQWPLPIKHGAPMITPMMALAKAGRSDLLGNVAWIENDCTHDSTKQFIRHDWQGTVRRTSGYHYDTQAVGTDYDHDVLPLIPTDAYGVVEVGCGNGALARAFKRINPVCHYTGVDIDTDAIRIARTPCDFVFQQDIELADSAFFEKLAHTDCWVFANVLAYLRDPLQVLTQIRAVMPAHGSIVISAPNMQHWSVQSSLNQGFMPYQGSGLVDPRHRRWFTRSALVELLSAAGFRVAAGVARMGVAPSESVLSALRTMAQSTGANEDMAVQDAIPLHYIMRVVPQPQ